MLGELPAGPGVRIFQGVRPAAAEDLPRIPHAISAGRRLILIESVAWPPGRYQARADDRIHCDGTYIGQSVLPPGNEKCQAIGLAFHVRSPDRIRTGVTALRGRRPRPLDDGAVL